MTNQPITRGADVTTRITCVWNKQTGKYEEIARETEHHVRRPYWAHERIADGPGEDEAWKDL